MNIVWFRNDLRIADNPALWNGTREGDTLALFILTPGQWRRHFLSGARVDFMLRTLETLRESLVRLGIPLLIERTERFAAVPALVAKLARRYRADAVYWNDEYPLDEIGRDRNTEALLRSRGVAVHRYADRVIAPPGSVVKEDGEAYRVFTPFKRRWLQLLDLGIPDTVPAPGKRPAPSVEGGPVPKTLKGFAGAVPEELWPAGEAEAQARLAAFCRDVLPAYHRIRDYPALAGTSKLSPYLAIGALSPQQCLRAALAQRGEGPDAWLNELIWRDFYQHIVLAFPDVCRFKPFKPETDKIPWREDREDFRAWCEGRTGVPIVDAGMRQLRETGWMHNRVRMIVAMFLSKNLLLDWRLGERFFMENLVDGDFAANNGGWQWSASTGTDSVPYFRVFNPFTQARRFDPDARYIKHFVPALRSLDAATIHNPETLEKHRPGDYPPIRVDIKGSRQRAIEAFRRLD